MKKLVEFIHHFAHPLDQTGSTLLQTCSEPMQSLPLCLQMEDSIILGIKNAWFPAKKGNDFLRTLSGKKKTVIIGDAQIPLDPPDCPPDWKGHQLRVRRHFSEQ